MNPPAAPDYFELSDYTTVLRRRWRRIAVVTLAGVVLAAAYVFLAPKTYTATVLVQVNALPNNANAVGGRTGGPVNMDNEAQSVRSLAVAKLVKKRLQQPAVGDRHLQQHPRHGAAELDLPADHLRCVRRRPARRGAPTWSDRPTWTTGASPS